MKNCDIIIPVYNAFDFFKKCVESVLKNTDLQNNRLIIIDDKSTDKRIVPFVESCINKREKNIVLIKNEDNLGFIKTVNIGMKLSDNDVLLLNSDTEVTEDWLIKLQRCAYGTEDVATVTPLSNNGTIASIPLFAKVNEIPLGYSLKKYQSLIDKISYKEYPEIPTGVGFCLFIKREALDNIGLFDEESYGIGYGEEEDFCYRCLNYGYKHILCDDVIVYHKSEQSFLDHYKKISDQRMMLLNAKYPFYKGKTDRWCDDYPLKYINKNINYSLCLNNSKANILVLVHAWEEHPYDYKNIGGTTLHAYDLIKGLTAKYNFHVLAPYNGVYRLCSYWETGEESVIIYSTISDCYFNNFYNAEYSKILKDIIQIFNIDIIHIQHMMGHYFDILNILSEKKNALLITLHDLYSVCPRVSKVSYENEYCVHPNEEKCSYCLSKNGDMFIDSKFKKTENIGVWKKLWNRLFSYADRVIVPSEAERELIIAEYKHLNIDIIEHGIEIVKKQVLNIDSDTEFNVAFLGSISRIKGKKIVEELIQYSDSFNDNIHFHLFGLIYSYMFLQTHKNFTYHGLYYRNDLGKLFKDNNIKLVCIFSIWPESYSYTLTESVANNVPVLAIDIGAVGERVKKNKLGWLLKTNADIPEIYRTIKDIFNDKENYKNVSKSIFENKIIGIAEMCNEYDKLYSAFKLDKGKKIETEKLKAFLKINYLYSTNFEREKRGINNSFDKEKKEIYASFEEAKNQIYNSFEGEKKEIYASFEEVKAGIFSSYTWRIGRLITWFPRKIRGLIKRN